MQQSKVAKMAKDVDLNKLRIFREVALAGSFSQAALNLKWPKSRISRVISSLEKDLGTQLIYRTTRQFHLTEAGNELFQRISPLMVELKNSLEFVSSESEEMSQLIKITAPEDLATELLGKICHDFIEKHPRVEIGLDANNAIIDIVKESVDISIRVGRVKDSTMIQKKIGKIERVLVISPKLFRVYQPKRLEDLPNIPFLAFESSDLKTHKIKMTNGKESKTIKVNPRFGSNNFFVLRSMTLQDTGISLLPVFLVKNLLKEGKLVQVCPSWKAEGLPIQILLPQQKEIPKKIRTLVNYLTEQLGPYF
jgi:DNA-binding transcriptional LysR family regulator